MNVAELKPNAITNEQVDAALAAFRKSLADNKAAAQAAAVAALLHCYQHRTAAKLRDMLAVIENEGKDFVRLAPFTLWLAAFAPVKMVTKEEGEKKVRVLEFDKESKLLATADANIEAATGKLWWTMSRDKEATAFDLVSFDKRVLGLAKKALAQIDEGKEAVDEKVRAYVAGLVAQFERAVAADKAAVAAVSQGRKAA